jgi:CxxC-x17-CxxC domain-containing protein
MNKINFFAKTNFRNQERVFGIKEDDRRRHMYVVGKTGMGKSNLMENMAIQDIRNGKGVCFIDPHGDGAEKLIRAVPAERINDVVYFNPADSDFPLAFNILESVEPDKKNLVASGMMGVFKKIWPDVWSPRMEYILNNTILALLDYPGSTMLGVNRMMSDKDFRKRIYPKVADPIVKSFWLNEFEKWDDKFRKEAVAAIQNKVGQFLSSSIIRHIIGQPKSTIDMRQIMDEGKILIVNLSKGRIGEDAMRLLGGMIVTKLQLAAMGRVEIPEEERKDFYLYVDEFQNFVTESFANILSEARKYRLCLTLGHQYINQLVFDGNSTVRDAIFGNVGTMVVFRVGAEDAEFLEKEFEPIFFINDIVNLAKYQMYLKLMIDGVAGDAFSATSLPPIDISETAIDEEKVIRVSRERYGKSRKEVEEKIARWSGMITSEEFSEIKSNASTFASSPSGGMNETTNFSSPARRDESARPANSSSRSAGATRPERLFAKNRAGVSGNSEGIQKNGFPLVNPPAASYGQNVPKKEFQEPSRNNSYKTEKVLSKNVAGGKPEIKLEEKKLDFSEKPTYLPDRQVFETVCSTCEEKIQVPFRPDPSRPTFCKECLKDYQRARAKALSEVSGESSVGVSKGIDYKKPEMDKPKEIERTAFVPKERPMSLHQMAHIAPKKFDNKSRPTINLGEVRDLIQKTKKPSSE